jgi:hypothetical protein
MNRLTTAAFFALAVFLTSCASTPRGPQFVQQPSQPSSATLYVFRLDTPPYARKPDIRINGTVVAELPTNSYFAVSLQPGKYEIKSDYGLIDNLILSKSTAISVSAGSSYFVEFTGRPGIYGTSVTYGAGITAVEASTPPERIRYCTQVRSDAGQVRPQ